MYTNPGNAIAQRAIQGLNKDFSRIHMYTFVYKITFCIRMYTFLYTYVYKMFGCFFLGIMFRFRDFSFRFLFFRHRFCKDFEVLFLEIHFDKEVMCCEN